MMTEETQFLKAQKQFLIVTDFGGHQVTVTK
jgi:hypothetical protein